MRKSIFLFLFLLVACTYTSSRQNSSEDINNAKALADKFYKLVKNKDFDKASAMCGQDFPSGEMKRILTKIDSLWGGLKEYELLDASTSVNTVNGRTTGEYDLKFRVQYDSASNKNTEEIFMKAMNDSIKIAGYHSNQDL